MQGYNLSRPVFRSLLGLAICWTASRTMALEPAVKRLTSNRRWSTGPNGHPGTPPGRRSFRAFGPAGFSHFSRTNFRRGRHRDVARSAGGE